MRSRLFLKLAVITALTVGLLLPLIFVGHKVTERSAYAQQAKQEVAKGWADPQTVLPPILLLTYEDRVERQNMGDAAIAAATYYTEVQLADAVSVVANVDMQRRYKGIYSVPVYTSDVSIKGKFPALKKQPIRAELVFSLNDIRGLQGQQVLEWQGKKYQFDVINEHRFLRNNLQVELDLRQGEGYSFSLQTVLRGVDSLAVVPAAKDFDFTLQSKWPHPSFVGQFLPADRDVSTEAFTATWNVSHFSTGIGSVLEQCLKRKCAVADYQSEALQAEFVEPINIYQLTDRSLKYGVLFIALSFMVFFLFECLKGIVVHPMQYGMVGLALAVFYLLLISLSEHLAFGVAYLLAMLACMSLIYSYLSSVIGNRMYVFGVVTVLSGLYGLLYAILQSEDYALLTGSTLVFVVLAALMLLTRKVDWYDLSKQMDFTVNRRVVSEQVVTDKGDG